MSEEQKIQELLRKRAKVENKWPGCQFEVGDILINDGDFYWVIGDVSWHGKIPKQEVEPFPYLMTPLPWWSDRNKNEMPGYVKDDDMIYKAIWQAGVETENGMQSMILIIEGYGSWPVIPNVMCFFEVAT